MDIQPNAQEKKFQLTPLSPKDFELAPVTAEAFMPENMGGITPEQPAIEVPEQERQGFIQGLGRSMKVSLNSLAEMPLQLPQAVESLGNMVINGFANGVINREVKRGNIDGNTADILKKNKDVFTPQASLGLPALPGTDSLGEDISDSKLTKWLETNQEEIGSTITRYDKTATEYLKDKQFGKALGAITYGVAESFAPTIAAAFMPGGAVALGVGTAAQKYDEVKDREDMAEGMKVADAVTTGIFEWLFEKYGTAEMTKMLRGVYAKAGAEGLQKAVNSGPVIALLSKAYKKFGVWFAPVHEGLSEALTTIGQNLATQFSGEDPDMKWNDNLVDSFLIGTGMGGMFGGTAALANKVGSTNDSKTIQRDQLAVDTFGDEKVNELAELMRVGDQEGISAFLYNMEIPEGKDSEKKTKALWKLAQKRASQPLTVPEDPDAPIKAEINQYGEKLKFNSNVPLAEDQNPLIRFAKHKTEIINPDPKAPDYIIIQAGGVEGDPILAAYDYAKLQESQYKIGPDNKFIVRPIMITEGQLKSNLNIPYAEWLQQEVNQFKQTQVQGQQMVVKAQAPVMEGQEITLGDKTFNVTFVDETGITLNEIDKQGNITGGELIVPPEDYEKVFGVPAQSGQISPLNDQALPENVTEQGQIIPEQVTNTGQPAGNIPEQVQLPVNKKGEIEYDQITEPEIYAQGLTEEFGEDAPAILDELIAEQITALEKAKKGPNAIERARKLKAINAELNKLSGVKEILTPTAIAEGPSLEAPSASPVVEQPEVETQATEQDLARPEEELEQNTPSTPDETAPVEAEMQEAGDVEQVNSEKEPTESELKEIVKKWEDEWDKQYKRLSRLKNVSIDKITENTNNQLGISLDYYSKYIVPNLKKPTDKSPEVELTKANAEVEPRPTEAQKEAGNFPKGHFRWQGMDISIENAPMSVRSGTDKSGKEWKQIMHNPYGYIRRTLGPETEGKDQVDIFLGDNLESETVFVVDQVDPETGLFDEPKIMGAFSTIDEARDAYLANYEPGWKGLGAITAMPLDEFKQWVYDREKTSRPVDAKVLVKGEKKADNRVAQWVDAFNKAKESNDLNAIQDVYDKVLVYLNGPAQKYGEQAVNDFTQLKGQIEAYAEEAKNKDKAKSEFAGDAIDNAPKTRSLREFTKGDHVKNVKTGNEYEVVSVEKTGDVSLKKLGEKQIKNFNGKLAQWIPIQREIKAKRAKRTVKFGPDSQKGKLLARMPQTFKEFVLQFFVRGGRVSHADFLRYVGWKAGKKEGFIWAVKGSADGKTEQGKAFDSFWEDVPEEWGRRGGTEDTNEISDILKTYPSITQMMDELKRLQSTDESVPDRNMPSPEELGAAVSDADIEDDLSNHEDEIVGTYDDMWDNPDYQIIFDKYSGDKGLDVDKLLADINDNPGEISTLTPFGLNDKELNTLKKYLEDEQSRRKESQGTESIQGLDQDKGQSGEKDSSRSGQGDTVRSGSEEGRRSERNEVVIPGSETGDLRDSVVAYFGSQNIDYQKSPI